MRADYQPLLVVVEDLQWIDPSSLDLLTQLIEHVPRTRQLVVLSFRPEFKPPWPDGPGLERLDLNRLDREASARIVTEIAGMPAPAELLDQLVEKADGVPLYLEELTKLVSEQGLIRRGNGRLDPARPAGTSRPGNARGLADSTSGPSDRCQGCRPARGSHRPAILIRATRSRGQDDRERGHAGAAAPLGPVGRRLGCVVGSSISRSLCSGTWTTGLCHDRVAHSLCGPHSATAGELRPIGPRKIAQRADMVRSGHRAITQFPAIMWPVTPPNEGGIFFRSRACTTRFAALSSHFPGERALFRGPALTFPLGWGFP